METVVVRSGMQDFRLVRRICGISPQHIRGEAQFVQAPVYAGLEAMAQLAALHVRHRLSFERHAFLLKVRQCKLPETAALKGRFLLSCYLRGKSTDAFIYDTAARGADQVLLQGSLLIGTQAYDGRFRRDRLKVHYQETFADLME